MTRVGKKATSCGKTVENWRKNKMHDQVISPTVLSARPPSAGCAATSNPLPVLPQPNACCRKAGGHSARPAAHRSDRTEAGHQQWLFVVYSTLQMIHSACYTAHVHSDIACYIVLLHCIAGVLYSKGVIWQIRCYIAVTQDSKCRACWN